MAGGLGLAAVLSWPRPPDFTNTWATVILGLLALGAALFSAAAAASSTATARRAYGQQLYELARSVHADLTTGEVAQARDRLGRLVRDRQRALAEAPADQPILESLRYSYDPTGTDGDRMRALRRDWFSLLWCFQRVYAAYELLTQAPAAVVPKGQLSPREFLARLVRAQIVFLNDDLVHARAAIEEFFGAPVDDHESAEAFRAQPGHGRGHVVPEPGRWADPISTNESETLRGSADRTQGRGSDRPDRRVDRYPVRRAAPRGRCPRPPGQPRQGRPPAARRGQYHDRYQQKGHAGAAG